MKSQFQRTFLCAYSFMLCVFAFGCQSGDVPNGVATGSDSDSAEKSEVALGTEHGGLVGSRACVDCHADIYDSYTKHPMWNSTIEVEHDDDRAWSKGDKFVIPGKKRVLTSSKESHGHVVHSESMFDETGRLIYEQPHQMDYVIGSGQRAKAYIRQVDERLYVSPLNWYAKSDLWALAPGYRQDDIRRFQRRATEDCMGCHSGFPNSIQKGTDRFASPPFHERSIGCERCHGEGAGHIAFQSSSYLSNESSDQIVNPSKLSIEQREAVCYQCHLEARARVLRPGKTHLDFKPGMELSDVWAIVDFGTEVKQDGTTRSVNHVQQMRDSKCYIQSEKRMGCISCHDPHSTPALEDRVEYYRNRCNECHGGKTESQPICSESSTKLMQFQNDCIACHMPSLDSTNMSHVAQTDHRILRKPLNDATEGEAATTLSFFDDHGDAFPGTEKQRNLVLGTIIHCQRRGVPIPDSVYPFLLEIAKSRPDDAALFSALGALAQSKNDLAKAREFYQRALSVSPEFDAALDGVFDIAFIQEDWRSCITYSDKLLKSEPRYGRVIAMRGEAFARMGQLDQAIEEWEKAVEIDPGFEVLHQMLADAYAQKGDQSKVSLHSSILRKLQTASVPAAISKVE